MSSKLIRRKSDGKFFRASHPDNWTDADAFVALLTGLRGGGYYFREIETRRKRHWTTLWLWARAVWVDTGVVWEPKDESDFELVSQGERDV